MTRLTVTLRNYADYERAVDLVRKATVGTRVEIKDAKRTDAQNRKFWSMLHDLSDQVEWHGRKRSDEDWKYLILDGLRREQKRELNIIPSIDGNGITVIGRSSSDLSVGEMGDAITIMEMFGANHGVKFHDTEESNSSDGSQAADRTDAPAANVPAAAGATNPEKWRDIAIEMLAGHRERPASLKHRLADLAQENGPFDELQTKWIETLFRLVMKKNKGEIHPVKYGAEINWLRTVPLSALRETA